MTVFNAFLKVLNKSKSVIIVYTVILIIFAGFNMQTNEQSTSFIATKPDILIINNNKEEGITKNLITYIKENSNIIDVKNSEEAINDALFYRDVNYIIYIPKNYREDFLDGKKPEIEVKSTGDYQASFAEMLLSRYLNIANTYLDDIKDEKELIDKINEVLSKEAKIEITSKLDTNGLEKATFYYNFANYSILAGCVYVICLILSTFKEEKISKRTIISSMNYKKYNRQLLISNILLAVILWFLYVVLSFILVGNIMFTIHGLIYIINSFIFTMCSVTIAFLIGNIVRNKEAINGIVNVIALGSSFLCGSFVPIEYLPKFVVKIAHILPSYYYINNNEKVASLEIFNMKTLTPILINIGIVLIFTFLFIIITNFVSKKQRKVA
ncbi:MAG: ABC transporter permease [Clostridia bacterium]|nr:ABC transporter permease [Clostridia bacterium]